MVHLYNLPKAIIKHIAIYNICHKDLVMNYYKYCTGFLLYDIQYDSVYGA